MLESLRDGFRTGLRAASGDRNPDDDRWWGNSSGIGGGSAFGQASSGVTVTPELAFQVSCFFLGVRLIAETVSTIPLKFYRDIGEDEKEVASDYWLRPVFDTRRGLANPWQTAQQWRETQAARMVAWGAGRSEIRPGRTRDQPIELWPLDNERTVPEQLPDGRMRFRVTRDDGTQDYLAQDQVCRIEGLSLHRFMPANVLNLAREVIGNWLAVERFEGLFFAQGARPSLYLEHPGKPDEPTYKRLKENVREWQGLRNMHRVFIGEQGMKPTTIGFSPRDAMLPEQRQQLALEVCRWLNLPPHMLKAGGGAGQEEAAASMEQLAQEYVDYTIRPLCVRIEAAMGRDLIPEREVFAEHVLEGLLRGDTLKRFQAYQIAIMNGFMAENEARVRENLPKVAGLDTPRRSVNQDRGVDPRQNDPKQTNSGQGSAEEMAIEATAAHVADALAAVAPAAENAAASVHQLMAAAPAASTTDPSPAAAAAIPRRILLMVRGNAERVLRKETAAIRDKAPKLASDPEAWGAWVRDFYTLLPSYVSECLQLEPSLAKQYADAHRAELLAHGLTVVESWMTTAVDQLTAMTTEERA